VCHGGSLPDLPRSPTFTGPSATANVQATACTPGSSFNAAVCYPLVQDKTNSTDTCNSASGSNGCLAAGDVDSAFLPWDADAFLYADASSPANRDPSFLGTLIPKDQLHPPGAGSRASRH